MSWSCAGTRLPLYRWMGLRSSAKYLRTCVRSSLGMLAVSSINGSLASDATMPASTDMAPSPVSRVLETCVSVECATLREYGRIQAESKRGMRHFCRLLPRRTSIRSVLPNTWWAGRRREQEPLAQIDRSKSDRQGLACTNEKADRKLVQNWTL